MDHANGSPTLDHSVEVLIAVTFATLVVIGDKINDVTGFRAIRAVSAAF
jgi:hypothetical protein